MEELAAFAIREGRRPRPIYTAHKWFARRLGSVFRALLVGAVTPEDGDFWRAYYGDATLQGLHVLDPFVGGGTSVVEAQRLGASAHGVDVDPIACSVTNLELTAADMPDLLEAMAHLQEQVGSASVRCTPSPMMGNSFIYCTISGSRSSPAMAAANLSMPIPISASPRRAAHNGSSAPNAAQWRNTMRISRRSPVDHASIAPSLTKDGWIMAGPPVPTATIASR